MIAYKDKRTPLATKILIGITAGLSAKSNRFDTRFSYRYWVYWMT